MKNTTAGALVGLAGVLAIGARVLTALGRKAELAAGDPEALDQERAALQEELNATAPAGWRAVVIDPSTCQTWDDLVAFGEAQDVPPHVVGQIARALGITPGPVKDLRDAMNALVEHGTWPEHLDLDTVLREAQEPLDTAEARRLRFGDWATDRPVDLDPFREVPLRGSAFVQAVREGRVRYFDDLEGQEPPPSPAEWVAARDMTQVVDDPSVAVRVPDDLERAYAGEPLGHPAEHGLVAFDGAELADLTEHGTAEDIQGDRLEDTRPDTWSRHQGY